MFGNVLRGLTLALAVVGCAACAKAQVAEMPVADLARLKARTVCSCLFVQNMSMDQCADGRSAIWRFRSEQADAPLLASPDQRLDVAVQADGGLVRMLSDGAVLAQSRYIADGGGCVTVPPDSVEVEHGPLVAQQRSSALPRGDLPRNADAQAIQEVLDDGFAVQGTMLGFSRAAVVIHGGRVVVDRYADNFGPGNEYYIGSISKVFNNLFAGLLTMDGKLDVNAAVDLPEWRGDGRRQITYDHLLRMVSGLEWEEEFFKPGAPAYEVYFAGNDGLDVARAVASRGLEAEPGTHFEYSTGASSLLAAVMQDKLGGRNRAETLRYLDERLFQPIGARDITVEFDRSGNLLTGHAIYSGAEDLARIGMLLRNKGAWDGRQLLPADWLDYSLNASTSSPRGEQALYGSQLMMNFLDIPGCFGHAGVGQQLLVVCPDRDLVVVWLSSVFNFKASALAGSGRAEVSNAQLVRRLVQAFPEVKPAGG